jgi:hypothetical protein
MDERILLLRFLLLRLRETKLEVNLHRAVIANLNDEMRPQAFRLLEFYREEGTIRRNTETEFRPFDELIEQFPQDSKALRTLLEKWNPQGDPN